MNGVGPPIWFWQTIISPHMIGLATALVQKGRAVTYVAGAEMTVNRTQLGWCAPSAGDVATRITRTDSEARALAHEAPANSVHICQGLRSNGSVGAAQRVLANRRLKHWVVMETVDDSGIRGAAKRIEYARLFFFWRHALEGVLAVGHSMPEWVAARGMPTDRVYPFAYFLPDRSEGGALPIRASGPFRFLFVGQFIARKRLDLLIRALSTLVDRFEFELIVVGNGPLEAQLRAGAEAALPGRVRWIGRLPQTDVPAAMAYGDCLVLPSLHDGWGAVVSEALMTGVPVICSNACGAAAAVRASGLGGVFRTYDEADLGAHLSRVMRAGPAGSAERNALTRWADCLGASAGAEYLLQIMAHRHTRDLRPHPPWTLDRPYREILSGCFRSEVLPC